MIAMPLGNLNHFLKKEAVCSTKPCLSVLMLI
nr:MAG TPA: hypothetical protein [Caudoviricetes sp.]